MRHKYNDLISVSDLLLAKDYPGQRCDLAQVAVYAQDKQKVLATDGLPVRAGAVPDLLNGLQAVRHKRRDGDRKPADTFFV